MPDDFQPDDPADDNDLSPPEIPDPDQSAEPAQGMEDAQPQQAMTADVEEMKAADAPAAESQAFDLPDQARQPLDTEPQRRFEPPDLSPPRSTLGDDIKNLLASDKPSISPPKEPAAEAPPQPAQPTPEPSPPVRDADHGAVPQTFLEFQQAVAGMKREDGQPWHKNAVANQWRRYKELGFDNGTEAPAGQEHLEIEARESDRAFYKEDKQRFQATTQLSKLLTQNAIENMREITQLKDALLRNRH